MKKNILFIMNNLNCGGAEKALVSLLQTMDYGKYNVDLLLFKKEGIFLNNIPQDVNLLKEPFGYSYFDMSIKKAILGCIKKFRFDIAINRLLAGFIFKTEKSRVICEQKVWKYISRGIKSLNKKYDVAIGYLEKNPIYYCVEKVNADKKIGFIHTDYNKLGMDSDIDMKYFGELDNIVVVSDKSAESLKDVFPMYKEKIKVIYNTILAEDIIKKAFESINFNNDKTKIVTVGRLDKAKGFEMAIRACKLLIDKGYDIIWYVIGEGTERGKLEELIKENKLEDNFKLLGIKENPYPYIKGCDIYVQTSLFEGRCLSITEAKILQKPIISTNFEAIYDQITNGENGIIVEKNEKAICDGIIKLLDNNDLRYKLEKRLSEENINDNNIEELYKLF